MTARHEITLIIKQHMESIEKAPSNATVLFVAKVKRENLPEALLIIDPFGW